MKKKLIKMISMFIVCIMIINMFSFSNQGMHTVKAQGVTTGHVKGDSVKGSPGESVSVPIYVTNNPGIVSLYMGIEYDDTVLKLNSVKNEGLFTDYMSGSLKKNPFAVSWEMASLTENDVHTGKLLTLNFTILDNAKTGKSEIKIGQWQANPPFDVDLNDVPFTYTNGAVTVFEKHEMTLVDQKEATCKTPGNVKYYHCSICNKNFKDLEGTTEIKDVVVPVNPDNHKGTTTVVDKKDSTCVTDGYTGDLVCNDCGKIIQKGSVIKASGHNWGEPEYAFAKDGSTCTAKRVCKINPKHVEETTATITSKVTKEPTCTESGETTYTAQFKESWAKEQTKVLNDIKATGHSYEWIIDKEATEKTPGSKHEECKVCGDKKPAVEIPVLPHKHKGTLVKGNPATCEKEGVKDYYKCACGLFFEDEACTKEVKDLDVWKVIPATGHDWGKPEYTFAKDGSTCTAKRVCKTDSKHVEEATAKVTGKVTKEATCTESGETTYTAQFKESWAKEQTKVLKDVEATGHNWGEPEYTFAKDGSTCTAKRVCKADPKHVEEATAKVTGKVTKEATCTEAGETTYTAQFKESWAKEQTKVLKDAKATGHDYEWIIDKEATEETPGSKHEECKVCGDKKPAVEIPVLSHKHKGTLVKGNPATCEKEGVKDYYECACGLFFEDEACTKEIQNLDVWKVIPATGHDWGTTEYTFAEDGSACTAKRVCKTDSKHVEEATAKVIGKVTKEATCAEAGETTYTAEFKESWAETQTKVLKDIPKTNEHSYDDKWSTDETNHWHECKCGDKTDIAAHEFEWIIDKEAIGTEAGEKHQECAICGYKLQSEVIPAPENPSPEYKVIKGADQIYNVVNKNGASFTINGAYDLFKDVYVDGKLVAPENYKAYSGSTVIDFTKEYMNTLALGKHTFKVTYSDGGEASTVFTIVKNDVEDNSSSETPKTGDNSMVAEWSVMMALLGMSIIYIIGNKRKKDVR